MLWAANKKPIRFLAPSLMLLLISMLLVGAQYRQAQICRKVNINILSQTEDYLIDKEEIKRLIGMDRELLGAKVEEVSLSKLEQDLQKTRFIKTTKAWFENEGTLELEIHLKNPIARVYSSSGGRFYIDEQGKKMPITSGYASRALLVTGRFNENNLVTDTLQDSVLIKLLPLVEIIHKNNFLNALISELNIDHKHQIKLYTNAGDVEIILGTLENSLQKLGVLEHFYKDQLAKVGWQYYAQLNLTYDNQIIGTKK